MRSAALVRLQVRIEPFLPSVAHISKAHPYILPCTCRFGSRYSAPQTSREEAVRRQTGAAA